jgi:hypothetical protein
MNRQRPTTPKPAPTGTVADLRKQPPSDMRSAVMLSLIVCPRGGVSHRRHGQGAGRASS